MYVQQHCEIGCDGVTYSCLINCTGGGLFFSPSMYTSHRKNKFHALLDIVFFPTVLIISHAIGEDIYVN